jgi:sugar/nucleoside kinase (ribokinase family)
MEKNIDCVVCGSCTVDVIVRPFPVDRPVGRGKLVRVDPIEATTGGIVSNSGMALARLGMRIAALTYVGRDDWAGIVQRTYQSEGIDTSRLICHPTAPTSATVVLVDASGERSFAHAQGAPKQIDRRFFQENLDLFARSRTMLLGYYSLMPNVEQDLPDVLREIRAAGCRTALDAAGDGGGLQPLDRILSELDFYVPSHAEASHQTGQTDPERIIRTYRACGAPGLVGVKLGARGALLQDSSGEYFSIDPVTPPGSVLDTTGAGDAFYAGLLCGVLRGLPLDQAGRLAAASGACCVTALGATAGLRDFEQTARLAGLAN